MVEVLFVFAGRVGEWLKPADCKSAAPCGLRRFESFPVHQDSRRLRVKSGARTRCESCSYRRAIARSVDRVAITPAMFLSGWIRGKSKSEPLRNGAPRRRLGGTGSAWVAQLVERVLGKDEVTGSIPVPGSRNCSRWGRAFFRAGVTQR